MTRKVKPGMTFQSKALFSSWPAATGHDVSEQGFIFVMAGCDRA
jgi:hypothetical protein